MLSLGKFKPSLVISALKKSVSESRISQKYDGLGVSDFENLDLGVSDFENLDLEISPMGRSIFYPQAYPKREIKTQCRYTRVKAARCWISLNS